GWECAVDKFLEDGVLDELEQKRLVGFSKHFGFSQEDLNINGAWTKIVKAAILQDIMNGAVPDRVNIQGSIPINLQKGETVVYAFADTEYLQDKTRRQTIGASQGVSIRIMNGVYYRVGAFKGRPVEYNERVNVDAGWFVVTNKHIYFAGKLKSFRIPYIKIVSFEPFSDAIGVMRDAASAKAQFFITGDGWFTYNMITNLSRNAQ
ncbi:hypothetical protein HGB07_07355, partial [Candidatus Roizmanbacteria bacterium]|nr:hypothetical protein [Candidatus Roizmanbacteria bacterium]